MHALFLHFMYDFSHIFHTFAIWKKHLTHRNELPT